jgi:putative hydrolase of the HAD superfamily
MKFFKHIFFDLDHTLWDFDRNSMETLMEIYNVFGLREKALFSVDDFVGAFHAVNYDLWGRFDRGEIGKEEVRANRFPLVFNRLGQAFDMADPSRISDYYMKVCPNKPFLMDGALDLLGFLAGKSTLHVITNGFGDVQHLKLKASGISGFFMTVTTAECTGAMKPDKSIFEHALGIAGALPAEALMIGDSLESDVTGAMRMGMGCAYFNQKKRAHALQPDFEFTHLSDFKEMLQKMYPALS